MNDLPTIVVIGYGVDLSWVSLVKAALTETYNQPALPAEAPVIRIPGGVKGQEFVVTLKSVGRSSSEKLFSVEVDPHAPYGTILFVSDEPIDPLQQRTGWFRKEILEAITSASLRAPMRSEHDLKLESLYGRTQPRDKDLEETFARVQQEVDLAFAEAEIALQPTHDLTVYFHPHLSQEQIKKSFAALADYYRSCGGTGFRVEFEEQDVRVPEVAYDGRW
jgi:hypothetical protein